MKVEARGGEVGVILCRRVPTARLNRFLRAELPQSLSMAAGGSNGSAGGDAAEAAGQGQRRMREGEGEDQSLAADGGDAAAAAGWQLARVKYMTQV